MKEQIIEALKNPEVIKDMDEGVNNAIINALKKAGVECTTDDVKELLTPAKKTTLDDAELANVAGGELDNTCSTGAAIACVASIVFEFAAFI